MSNLKFNHLDKLLAKDNLDLINYLDKVLGHRVNSDIWTWEFCAHQNTIFTTLTDNNAIIATQSMLPIKLMIGEQCFESSKSETSYLEAAYRGQKLFEKLYSFAIEKAVEKGSTLIWGFTPAVSAWKKNFMFSVHEENIKCVEILVKPYTITKAINNSRNIFVAIGKYFVKNIFVFKNQILANFLFKTNKKIEITNTIQNFSDYQNLFNEIKKEKINLIHIDYNKEYLNWRLKNNPVIKYETKYYYINSVISGWVTYSINNDRLVIVDLLYNEVDTLKFILKSLLQVDGDFTRIFYWGNFACNISNLVFKLFSEIGSIPQIDKARSFVYKPVANNNSNYLNDLDNWHINGLWTEGFNI